MLEDLSDTEHIVLISLLSLMQSACKEFFCSILVYLVKPAVVVLFDDYNYCFAEDEIAPLQCLISLLLSI